jgi:hypothetical protein
MARIQRSFATKGSKQEMKEYISTKLLPRPELKTLLDKVEWHGDTLKIDSKLGDGTLTVFDQRIEVDMQLSFFGSMAQKKIESALDENFKQLGK